MTHPQRINSTIAGSIIALGSILGACTESTETDENAQSLESEIRSGGPLAPVRSSGGYVQSATPSGTLDQTNPFFLSLGTNGRTCGSCHQAGEGWSIKPRELRERFDRTEGLDPIFLPHDGATSPNADVSTVSARRAAYALLLARGVIRVGLPVKPTSDFTLVGVEDPYGWASVTQLSMFRRPLPTTNLRFLSVINWDGRNNPAAEPTNIRLGLKNQSNGATVNHAKAAAPIDDATRESIVDLELQLTTAQIWQDEVGPLSLAGAEGGPVPLLTQSYAIGANDATTPGSTTHVFSIFDRWSELRNNWYLPTRRMVAEGQRIFNEKRFDIGNGRTGTCGGCHNSVEVGGSSSMRFFDVGVSAPERRASDVPLYTFQNIATGETLRTTDPGRALISGKWEDMNKFKVPGLRGLAARAPYFHDGSAPTIASVIDHYRDRFDIQLDRHERRQLEMFLESL